MALVLVVDDDRVTLDTYSRILRLAGHAVLTAETGRQGLALATEQKPELLLLDLILPDMTALHVIDGIRSEGVTVPCIVITGFGSIDSAVDAMKHGAVDYLTKPVYEDDLIAAVNRALGGSSGGLPAIVKADNLTRWAMAIASVVDARRDPNSLEDWSRIRNVSPATLRGWCRTADMPPKASLDLARVLRAVYQARARRWPVWRLLKVADPRTLSRLLEAAGLSKSEVDTDPPALGRVLDRQHLITEAVALHELRRVLREFNIDPDD